MQTVMLVAVVIWGMEAHAATAILERVEVTTTPQAGVTLHLSGPVAAWAGALALPERVFIDLPGTTLGPQAPKVLNGGGRLLRVRTAQRDASSVRVVLDLDRRVPYVMRTDATTVTVTLSSPEAAVGPSEYPASRQAPAEGAASRSANRARPRLFLDYPPFTFKRGGTSEEQ